MAYTSDESGRVEVYVTPYPGPGAKVQISANGGFSSSWAPDGGKIFYRRGEESDGTNSMWEVDVSAGTSFLVGSSRELFRGTHMRMGPIRGYDVTPDGKKFLMVKPLPRVENPVTHINVTLNWFEELKRLAPTD